MIDILFVDDEPNILDGLQRMLRPMRHEWNMSFASSGAAALELLEDVPVDVVVSDMKMPGMDGSQLLHAVSERYPQTIRIILSGYSEKEMILKTVGTAHQYISKPCDPDVLKATVNKVCDLGGLLVNENLRRLVSKLPNIPSLPMLYRDLVDELANDQPSTRKIADIVNQDIGMTIKMLQIVNSAFFGLRRHVSDAREAVEFLGLDTISSLTLGLGVISQFESQGPSGFLAGIWENSMAVGVMAKKIAAAQNREMTNDAFTAGLLHDTGKVVLAVNMPGEFRTVCETVEREGISRPAAERQFFGATGPEVGAYLLGLWGLPNQIVRAVAFHVEPMGSKTDSFSAITAVHAANAFRHMTAPVRPGSEVFEIDREYIAHIGLTDRVPVWQEQCIAIGESCAAA